MLANPGDHIIGIGKHVFERDPWVARSLFDAFEGSKRIWQGRRRLSETTPWLLAEIEDAMVRMGGHGLAAERRRSQ
jgi:hypothetical protein